MNKKLLFVFVLLCIAPIWVFEFPPIIDYPKHLFVAYAIKNIAQGFGNFFELNLFAVPNSLGYVFLIALNFFLPIFVAGKVFLSALIALFVFGANYFFDSLDRRNSWLPLVGTVFVFSLFFIIGFLTFLLAVSISFFVLGFWARNIENNGLQKKAILSALILLVYFTHLMAFFFLFFIIAAASFFYFKKPKEAIFSLLPFAPALAVFAAFLFATVETGLDLQPIVWTGPERKLFDFTFLLTTIRNSLGKASMLLASLALGVAAVACFLEKKRKKLCFRGNIKAALAASVVCGVLLFAVLPLNAGSYWPINGRLPIFLLFVTVAVIGEPKKQQLKRLFASLILLAAILGIASAFLFSFEAQQEIRNYAAAISLVEENSRLLPMHGSQNSAFSVFPISFHADSYYLIEKGGVSPYFYLTKMFPLNYRSKSFEVAPPKMQPEFYSDEQHAKHFDYVLAYGNREKFENELEKSFEKTFEEGLLALYKKKPGG